MNYDNLNQFMSFIQNQVKIVRAGVLYDALRHDQRVKRYLQIKKLRKDPLYDYSHRGIIKGKGSRIVTEPSELREVIDSFFMLHKA